MKIQGHMWAQSLICCLFLSFRNLFAEPGHYQTIQAKNTFIPEADFEVIGEGILVRSRLECAALFLIAKNKEDSEHEIGFHYDDQEQVCKLGYVPFPVFELSTGGILVSGLKKGNQWGSGSISY